MKRRCQRYLLLLVLSPAMLSLMGAAFETTFGSINVEVKDPQGNAVAGATVSCVNESTGQGTILSTNPQGVCTFLKREPGSYKLIVEARGFKKGIRPGVIVEASKPTSVPLQLTIGPASETVTIVAEAAVVDPGTTNRGTTVPGQTITELPLFHRDYTSLIALATGVAPDNTSRNGVGFAVNGSRASSTNVILDGIDTTDGNDTSAGSTGDAAGRTRTGVISTEALLQFRIQTSFDADAGSNAGGVVDLTIKSGSDDVRGDAFGFFSHEKLNARDFFDVSETRSKQRFGIFGVSIGGPFKKQKAWWFVSYEGKRDNKETPTLLAVPTNGDFRNAIVALGGNPAIPVAQNPVVNPVIRSLFSLCLATLQCPGGSSLWPQPTTARAGQVLNSISRTAIHNFSDQLVFKPNIGLNAQQTLSGYYSFTDARENFPLPLAGADELPRTNILAPYRNHLSSVSHSWASANKANELRFGWQQYRRDFLEQDQMGIGNPRQSIGLNTGINNEEDFGLPHILVRGFAGLGSGPFSSARSLNNVNLLMAERFTLVKGNHSIVAGYEFKWSRLKSSNHVNFRGELQFASLPEFLSGNVLAGSISVGDTNRLTTQITHAGFVHDNFRFRPQLTLSLGLRWEYWGVPRESDSLFSKYDPERGLIAPRNLFAPDLNNFSPRIGFAWDITNRQRTVLRAGFGVHYLPLRPNLFIGQLQFNTFNAGVAYNPLPGRPILTSRSPVALIQPGQPVFPTAGFSTDTRDVWTVDSLRTPYVYNYNINFQQEVLTRTVLEVAYVGSIGHRLFRTRDINAPIVPGGPRPFDNAALLSSIAPNRPFIVNQLESSANSTYNSLQLSFRQTSWHHLDSNVLWTWSHSIDNASDAIESVPNISAPDNPRMPSLEKANSNFDTRHRLVWNLTYDLPKLADGFGSGWQISSILTISSGQPYQINFGKEFDTQGKFDFMLRPDLAGDPFLATRAPDRLLNLAAFRVPCVLDGLGTDVSHCVPGTLHFGNLPRNAFRSPGFGTLDFSISKTFGLGEVRSLKLVAEFLNLTNHPNFTSPVFPRLIAPADLKGIDLTGRGGARGVGCNTSGASDDCYLPSTRTTGSRNLRVSMRLSF